MKKKKLRLVGVNRFNALKIWFTEVFNKSFIIIIIIIIIIKCIHIAQDRDL